VNRRIRRLATCAALILMAAAPALPAQPAPSVFLEELTWTELRAAIDAGRTTAIVPIGGTEQSGPAIVLGKHNERVRFLAGKIAQALDNAIVAPVIAYVPEGRIDPPSSHMRFAGTLSIPDDVFERTLEYAARSLRVHGFRDIVLLGDHGGYQRDLQPVADRLNREWAASGTRVHAVPEYFRAAEQGFAALLRERGFRDDEIGTHAALADTSLMLAIDPGAVRTGLLKSGTPLGAAQGVYGGDPRRASAQLGQLGVDEIVSRTVTAIRARVAQHPH
jgi:creatinine amidohydrolase/Fe(II)-dependent formamide hydrolase-like protein